MMHLPKLPEQMLDVSRNPPLEEKHNPKIWKPIDSIKYNSISDSTRCQLG